MFLQYEVWATLDGREELIECVGSLKEAEQVVADILEFNDEVHIIEDSDGELREIKRYQGL
jgi:hypothetical protein